MNKPDKDYDQALYILIKNIKELLRKESFDDAEALLFDQIEVAEANPSDDPYGISPWYYEQLSIFYHNTNHVDSEKSILDRFASKDYPASAVQNKLLKRRDELNSDKKKDKLKLLKRKEEKPLPYAGVGAVIDIATTGFTGKKEEIVELTVLLFTFDPSNGEVKEIIDEYSGMREPSLPIKPAARRIHGITDKEVKDSELDFDRILAILSQAEFIIVHNASFKRGLVEKLIPYTLTKPWYCSMNDIDWLIKGSNKDLHELLAERGIETTPPYRSQEEARSILRLLSCRGYNSIPYLHDLLYYKQTDKPQEVQDVKPERIVRRKSLSGFTAGILTMIFVALLAYLFFMR